MPTRLAACCSSTQQRQVQLYEAFLELSPGEAGAASSSVDTSELLSSGFKVLVAKTRAQEDWVKRLPPAQIRPMQRTGKKYFIYPDAPGNQIYIGGPTE